MYLVICSGEHPECAEVYCTQETGVLDGSYFVLGRARNYDSKWKTAEMIHNRLK